MSCRCSCRRFARSSRAWREYGGRPVITRRSLVQIQPPLLQEWLRTAALAKRTRDASSMRARLSLSTQGFRGVGQGGRSPRASESSPPGRADTPAIRPHGPKVSPGLSAGGCRVKTGSGPLERSLPPGSGALGRDRTDSNRDPRVMAPLTRRGMARAGGPKMLGHTAPSPIDQRITPGLERRSANVHARSALSYYKRRSIVQDTLLRCRDPLTHDASETRLQGTTHATCC